MDRFLESPTSLKQTKMINRGLLSYRYTHLTDLPPFLYTIRPENTKTIAYLEETLMDYGNFPKNHSEILKLCA